MNDFKLEKKEYDRYYIISIFGEVNPGTEEKIRLFLDEVFVDIKENRKNVIFDFKGLEYINSTGLGLLANFYRMCNDEEIKVMISGLNNMCLRLFEITKLDQIFEITESIDSAVAEID